MTTGHDPKENLPTRRLREHPDLDQLRRQAKELLEAFRAGDADAVTEVNAHYRGADPANFALHDAQLALARSYGFDSWPRLKACVDGATARRLVDAVRGGDLARVGAMLAARPELATMEVDNHQPLHHAVLGRAPEIVRVLMAHGADARVGIYPHRDATSPLAIATERGYDEIVAIIREAEQSRRPKKGGPNVAPKGDELIEAIASGGREHAIATLVADPSLVNASDVDGRRPLHLAAWALDERLVEWLLDHGADIGRRDKNGWTPLDAAASRPARGKGNDGERISKLVTLLRRRGAALTDRAAVALGDADHLRAQHAAGTLEKPLDGTGGLLTVAVSRDRPEMLALLLDLGCDPDERVRVTGVDEVEYSWGFPLWECAATGKHAMARMLLERGADPNGQVYASGSPVSEAYGQRDWEMVRLLAQYGGVADAGMAALYRQTELAKKLLAAAPDTCRAAEAVLGGAACGGDPEILRWALDRLDWPRDDPRWFGVLEQPLRIWNHGPGHWADHDLDRGTYLTCFRMILERCDPNILGRGPDRGQFGLTLLHSVAGSRPHMTAEERVGFATMLLDAGARLDVRDNLLRSTPLGWACRWGREELVRLLLERGADPVERDAEPWATPRAWAEKMGHAAVLAILRDHGGIGSLSRPV
jgi:ankyrin repeat protein